MAQVYSIDPLIRAFELGSVVAGNAQTVVLIDMARGTVTPRKPFFGDVRHYLVSNTGDARHVGTGIVSGFQLQDLECSIAVSMRFDARCRPGNEQKVALALFDRGALPGAVLERYLKLWLRELSDDRIADFVSEFFDDQHALEKKLTDRARAEIGLDMHVRLSLDAERSLNTIMVSEEVLATVSDYDDEEQPLEIKAGLEVDEHNKTVAILQSNRYDDLHELVPREVVRFIRQNVTMQAFFTQLNEAPVREPLIRHLNVALASFGRKIGTLSLEAEPTELQFSYQEDVDVLCRLHQYPRQVKISNKVQLILTDLARYRAAKSPPLKKWLQEKLERFIPQLLFEARYIDVLLAFEPFEEAIRSTVAQHAAAIGYQIKQFITVPDLEPIRLKDPFIVEAESSFATKLPNVSVKLQLIVTTRIPRLEDVKDKLNRELFIPRLMSDSILKVVGIYLHRTQPDRFYMRFDNTDPDHPEEKATVESELIAVVKEQLENEFHADVIDIVVKRVDTDLVTRLRQLQERICPFEVRVASLHGNEVVVFNGNFQVETVDAEGWYKFQLLRNDLNEIRDHLEKHLLAELHSFPIEAILYRDPHHRRKLTAMLQHVGREFVRNKFGLAIEIDSICREATPQERSFIQLELDKTDARLTIDKAKLARQVRKELTTGDESEAQLAKLLQQRTLLTGIEGAEEELADLDQKIAEAEAALDDAQIPSIQAVQARLLPERARKNSLKAYEKVVGTYDVPANDNPDQPRGDAE